LSHLFSCDAPKWGGCASADTFSLNIAEKCTHKKIAIDHGMDLLITIETAITQHF
jgi:hypothetical protein